MRVGRLVVLAILVRLIALPGFVHAQSATSGAIAGVVKDTSGAVLPGVTVEASSPALIEKIRSVVSDERGEFKIVDLRAGTYTVTFSLTGFARVQREGLDLVTGVTLPVSAELKVGDIQETITVTSATPVVDVQNVRTQSVMSRQVLDTLPTPNTIQSFSTLTLGATQSLSNTDVGGNMGEGVTTMGIHGNRPGEMQLMMDGMRYNVLNGTGTGTTKYIAPNIASTQEVVLEMSGTSAETENGGIQMNIVPKDGGNRFTGYANISGTNGDLQSSNMSDELRSRGLNEPGKVRRIYDAAFGAGGPLSKDRLWFYTGHRWEAAQTTVAGNFYNKTQHTLVYTPDLSRPAFNSHTDEDHNLRLTLQSGRHKISFHATHQTNCLCFFDVDSAFSVGQTAPEASPQLTYAPNYIVQSSWTFPMTSRLLLSAGGAFVRGHLHTRRQPEVALTDIAYTELSTGLKYNARAQGLGLTDYSDNNPSAQGTARFAVSYITGSHAFKTGMFFMRGYQDFTADLGPLPVNYAFRLGVPVQITQYASPAFAESYLGANVGLYAQDQWTLSRLTLNLGVRMDYLNGFVPAQTRPAGIFGPALDVPRIPNVPNWKDVSPRFGAAYNLFGNSKTAVKMSIGRYVQSEAVSLATANNPANTIVTSATRTWNDANTNFVPDCDLKNSLTNGECGPLSNQNFGKSIITTRYDPELLTGYRGYSWQMSAGAQHELKPGIAVQGGYFRTWYGNFRVTDNLLVTPADYSPYCVTAPTDPRLPGGGGFQTCGLFDLVPAKFGQVSNLVTKASNFGTQSEVYNGFQVGINARFGRGGLLTGGVSAGQTVTNNCFAVDSPQQLRYCEVTVPYSAQTQVKFQGVYPLPVWDIQAALTYQNIGGPADNTTFVATNAQIAPSLGRNLAACGAAVTCTATVSIPNLFEPNTKYENRLSQLDMRLTKILRFRTMRIKGTFDIYNLFNANTILAVNGTYGPSWLRPATNLAGRLLKFGAQFDF